MSSIYLDKLYFINYTGNQYKDLSKTSCLIKCKADIEFIKNLKNLPSLSDPPKKF